MNTEREAFEKWIKEYCDVKFLVRQDDVNGHYANSLINEQWEAWQAATAALQKRIEELEADQPLPEQFYLNYIRTLQSALKRLSFAAQTSGGTAGKDDELMAAIEQAGEALKFKTAAQAYGDVQAKEEWKLVPIEPTDEMIKAGDDTAILNNEYGEDVYIRNTDDVYKAMIAAAPTDMEDK